MTTSGPALRLLQQVTQGLQSPALNQRIGGIAQRLTQRHLRVVNRTRPNRLGGPRTNFYGKAAQATFFTVTPQGVVITIAQQGMRQRFAGGVIRPVTKKYLAIPATAEAHGKRPGEFDNLVFTVLPGFGPVLVKAIATPIKVGKVKQAGTRAVKQAGVSAGGDVVFYLRRKVTQKPDPTVIPNAQDFNTEIAADLAKWMTTLAQRAASSGARTA